MNQTSGQAAPLRLLVFPAIREQTGISHAEWYRHMARGTAPRPVKIGTASRWPAHEIDALITARIAGKTDAEMVELVKAMHAARAASREAAA